eukprot:9470458-Pyramimonas_sp.AAC.1
MDGKGVHPSCSGRVPRSAPDRTPTRGQNIRAARGTLLLSTVCTSAGSLFVLGKVGQYGE